MPKIIVSNLPTNFEEEDIRTLFSIYGKIKSITKYAKTNSFFIFYEKKEDCEEAIKSMNGRMIQNCAVYVDMAHDRDSKIFVFNIPNDCDLKDLKSFFSYYGEINSLQFINNYVQIVFEDKEDCSRLLNLDNKIRYQGCLLSIKKEKTQILTNVNTVFVYNLPIPVSEQDFNDLFVKYGKIISSGVLENGKGFINYEKELGALKATKYLDKKVWKGKKLKVILKKSSKN
ncbi:RNA-binding protein 4 [Nosema bombycis CQ1]|uniref:RNA-binding protein 4 n=1 Tax=Nosema bombycis (strain CQ1 / CVCC 102059) TaxID=578461 RepID=R0M881_NOSB1|nr:RNA-binding protein 4 [Nosema bombycis CQ1]|eukprot:EOB14199.1 RNA-binding protein 4 [Nosema bombycis CQ1]